MGLLRFSRMRQALAIVLLCTLVACGDRPPVPQHVVLITMDTTRADHIGAYGSTVSTPNLDALAAESVVFDRVASCCTTTLPSHVSLMSGRWPVAHGVARNGYVVHDDNVMLAEILAGAGFRTIGVSAALELSDMLDFPQGFSVWDQDDETYAGHIVANRDARRAEEITNAVFARLGDAGLRSDERLFLFVHYIDPHIPYDPPEPFRSAGGPVPDGFVGDFREVRQAKARQRGEASGHPNARGVLPGRLDETQIRRTLRKPLGSDLLLAQLYAGEVSYMDHHIGRLLQGLRERGLYDDALIVVTADHGETFWEHGDTWGHGLAVYDTNARVPLIIRFPGAWRMGTRVDSRVSNVDVLPTLLDLLGLDPPGVVDGTSLLPIVVGEARDESRTIVTQAPLSGGVRDPEGPGWVNRNRPHGIYLGHWKYVLTPYLEIEELFDLEADPGEQHDLLLDPSPEDESRASRMRSRLEAWIAAASPLPSEFFPRRQPDRSSDRAADRQAMWERLRSLGYVTEEPPEPNLERTAPGPGPTEVPRPPFEPSPSSEAGDAPGE